MQCHVWAHPATLITLAPTHEWHGYRFVRGDIHRIARMECSLVVEADRVNPFVEGGLKRWQIGILFESPQAAERAEVLIANSPFSEISIPKVIGLIGVTGRDVETWGEVAPLLNSILDKHSLYPISGKREVPALYLLEAKK